MVDFPILSPIQSNGLGYKIPNFPIFTFFIPLSFIHPGKFRRNSDVCFNGLYPLASIGKKEKKTKSSVAYFSFQLISAFHAIHPSVCFSVIKPGPRFFPSLPPL